MGDAVRMALEDGLPALGVVSTEERLLYRAYLEEPESADRLLRPVEWLASSALFRNVPQDIDPGALARLHLRRDEFERWPTLEKCVAEAVYERTRVRVRPDAPSRLHCLFAALDAESAMAFAIDWMPEPIFDEHGLSDLGAMQVRTNGARWIAVDMNLFGIPERIDASEIGNDYALRSTGKRAEKYWSGQCSKRVFVEVLADSLTL
jgi:hypothetical protein